MTQTLEFISVPPDSDQAPLGLIVTLHGWGASADDVAGLLPYFDLPDYQFAFPNAPYPYPYAATGRAWYDLREENMYQGLTESRQILTDWLLSLESVTGVPLSRTVLSGFSQGAAMTLDVGLNLPLAGLVAMSGYLHPEAGKVAKDTFPPTLITHGRQDEVVPLSAAVKAKATLEALGVPLQYQEFDMGHEIGLQVLELLRNFIINAIE
ncbi:MULTISPECIES: alpha/beta hydrolase [Calothrix]|uniref:Alpha/beta hydrolase n=2 Tax=Calothrix TaxID=1186 RepID=A0ABR8A7G4_9CYAN|nr:MULTISPECIES: alpha/beta hydrolase [Calothrix]MBD2195936.1 alpha/beta hydrolase [Calothrix parietina FACHB-288]MBD2224574.1 alpha/beta hydrolase [Calothrix anomala FACHB-343]